MHPSTKSARAGHIFDECDGDGPPKGGFLGDENAMQTSMCVGTQSKFVPNAIVTAHQKVESGETKMQTKKKNNQLCKHAGHMSSNAMETRHQKVDLGETELY